MTVKQHLIRVSDEAWAQMQREAAGDNRSVSAYLDVLFTARAQPKRPATPARPAMPKRAVITSDDAPADPIVHVPFDGEA